MIEPGSSIGVFGGGQLGRMLGMAARRMGYGFRVFEPSGGNPACPAGHVADAEVHAPYSDQQALQAFVDSVDTVTYEFENIPVSALQQIDSQTPLRPNWKVLEVCQNRKTEKTFLGDNGYPVAPFAVVDSAASLRSAIEEIGTPSVLKTATMGYDGKGQLKLNADKGPEDAEALWEEFGNELGVLEGWVEFSMELSVICARGVDGQMETFPVAENIHRNHILDFSIVPARVSPEVISEAEEIGRSIAETLEVVGLITAELFLADEGKLLVNELAPRPHNSGHYSFDACLTNQFEQQARAVCELPLGSTHLLSPVVMVNLLGEAWDGENADWSPILTNPNAKLHIYGKQVAAGGPPAGRKMGHYCVLGDTLDSALQQAEEIQKKLLNL